MFMQIEQLGIQTQAAIGSKIGEIAGFLKDQNQAFVQKELEVATNSAEVLDLKQKEIASLVEKLESQQAEMDVRKQKTKDKQQELQDSKPLLSGSAYDQGCTALDPLLFLAQQLLPAPFHSAGSNATNYRSNTTHSRTLRS